MSPKPKGHGDGDTVESERTRELRALLDASHAADRMECWKSYDVPTVEGFLSKWLPQLDCEYLCAKAAPEKKAGFEHDLRALVLRTIERTRLGHFDAGHVT